MRRRTSAQKKRQRERLKSVKKQQSNGVRDVNTDRYNNWGLPQGASPPTSRSDDPEPSKTSATVKRQYIEEIVSRFGEYDGKAWGFTVRAFPLYAVENRGGEWRVQALLFSMEYRGESRLYMSGYAGRDSRSGPSRVVICGPTVASTETKQAALEMLGASGSRRMEARRGKTPYLVCGGHVEDGHTRSFTLARAERDRVHEMNRDGAVVRLDENISAPSGRVPERVL